MPVVVILEYQVSDHQHFTGPYKDRLLPAVRSAPGFRHIQVVHREFSVLILIEFDLAEYYERFKKHASPTTFPPAQDRIGEEVLWTLPNTSFPLANARQYKPRPAGPRAQAQRRKQQPRIRHPVRPRWACIKCHEQPYIFVNITRAPDFAAYQECRCGQHRIDDLVTIRWSEFSQSD